ncbi:MAG: hypothetical protein IJ308_03590 [Clostridia bacterium]|nr:hypothetical protein [Clostridia bacterium]
MSRVIDISWGIVAIVAAYLLIMVAMTATMWVMMKLMKDVEADLNSVSKREEDKKVDCEACPFRRAEERRRDFELLSMNSYFIKRNRDFAKERKNELEENGTTEKKEYEDVRIELSEDEVAE